MDPTEISQIASQQGLVSFAVCEQAAVPVIASLSTRGASLENLRVTPL